MATTVRLAKHLTGLVSCSRREAEQYIESGWVQVDGQVIEEPGFRLEPQQVVTFNPQASLALPQPVTILLNKPVGIDAPFEIAPNASLLLLLSAQQQAAEDRSGIQYLKRHGSGLTLATPLEASTSGLVILTQDWRVARKLIDDAARVEQEFIVEVKGELGEQGLELLNHGLSWNGKPLAPMKVSWQNETRLRFALKGVQRGQLSYLCEKIGLTVLSIKRIRVGRIPVAGLPLGQWRYLMEYERF